MEEMKKKINKQPQKYKAKQTLKQREKNVLMTNWLTKWSTF